MTWKSHIAIAVAITLPFNPSLISASILGCTAPDWSEWILRFFGIRVQHRGFTHYVYIPLLIILLSFFIDVRDIIFWFGVGYLSHWFADSLTPSGVPLSQFDNHRIHLFGGRIRTGSFIEYVFAFGFLIIVVSLVKPFSQLTSGKDSLNHFNVYFNDYSELYEKNIIDEKTYKESRFKLF